MDDTVRITKWDFFFMTLLYKAVVVGFSPQRGRRPLEPDDDGRRQGCRLAALLLARPGVGGPVPQSHMA